MISGEPRHPRRTRVCGFVSWGGWVILEHSAVLLAFNQRSQENRWFWGETPPLQSNWLNCNYKGNVGSLSHSNGDRSLMWEGSLAFFILFILFFYPHLRTFSPTAFREEGKEEGRKGERETSMWFEGEKHGSVASWTCQDWRLIPQPKACARTRKQTHHVSLTGCSNWVTLARAGV